MMADVRGALQTLEMEVAGFLGAALVDHQSGTTLGLVGDGIDLEAAAASNTEVVRSKLRVMKQLEIGGSVEDILIALSSQLHLVRPIGDALFLYLVIGRRRGNLAMARAILARTAQSIAV